MMTNGERPANLNGLAENQGCRVHIYEKYAEYGPCIIMHLRKGFTCFLSYFLSYSAMNLHIILRILMHTLLIYHDVAYAEYEPCTIILHIFCHIPCHIQHIILHILLHIFKLHILLHIWHINFHIQHIL